ncbi:hypothetical protein A3715_17080 [Oleiphilus sp. HI0009]|nr:hypothetical protein A3715_19365 [Oleiphilus sp. HI0009]KZX85605.1 hypothetical protein A3715_17080 [Oleiphilus sp. HI0009]
MQDIVFSDGSFACHKTVDYSDESEGRVKEKSEHCAELLIMQEKMKAPNQTTRIAERLGLYDHKKLNMDAPVYDSVNDYLNEIDKQK